MGNQLLDIKLTVTNFLLMISFSDDTEDATRSQKEWNRRHPWRVLHRNGFTESLQMNVPPLQDEKESCKRKTNHLKHPWRVLHPNGFTENLQMNLPPLQDEKESCKRKTNHLLESKGRRKESRADIARFNFRP